MFAFKSRRKKSQYSTTIKCTRYIGLAWLGTTACAVFFPHQINFLSEFCQNIYSYFKYHYTRQRTIYCYYVYRIRSNLKNGTAHINSKAKREIDIFFNAQKKTPITHQQRNIHSTPINVFFFAVHFI